MGSHGLSLLAKFVAKMSPPFLLYQVCACFITILIACFLVAVPRWVPDTKIDLLTDRRS
jgi:hypothetical protein